MADELTIDRIRARFILLARKQGEVARAILEGGDVEESWADMRNAAWVALIEVPPGLPFLFIESPWVGSLSSCVLITIYFLSL